METIPSEATIVDLALRCYPVVPDAKPRGTPPFVAWPPETVLVFDTESTTDARQQLTFGSWRGYQLRSGSDAAAVDYELGEEGLFYADDAPPEAIDRLRAYVDAHRRTNGGATLQLCSQRAFAEHLLQAAARARTLVAAFNFPFDVSRLAYIASSARGERYRGFSFALAMRYDHGRTGTHENRYRPRIGIKSIDAKRAVKGLTKPFEPTDEERTPDDRPGEPQEKFYVNPRFLDVRTLGFALTDRSLSLDAACAAFGVERKTDPGEHPGWAFDAAYVDYNRNDTAITGELLFAMLREYARHPVDLRPPNVYSPASIGKAYLRSMGISPPLSRWRAFPPDKLGATMSTFYGGRTSARIRRFLVPVRYCDFLSMYPTVNSLLGTWQLLTAADYRIVDATGHARSALSGLTLDAMFDPATWPTLAFFARIIPNGDVLPVRARWDAGDARQIGINPLTARDAVWYAGPDLATAVLLGKKVPHVLEAFAIEPARDADGVVPLDTLQPVELLGKVHVDPRTDDFFRLVIEERRRAKADPSLDAAERRRRDKGLKVIANATSYGIFAQVDSIDVRKGKKQRVDVYTGTDRFSTLTTHPERAGEYFFPPIAALITSAARCMLATLERCVTDAGGTYAMEDTDSMAIVATEDGGLVPCPGGPHPFKGDTAPPDYPAVPPTSDALHALSFAEVNAIVARFAALNPYDPDVVRGSILEVEEVNFVEGAPRQLWCYAISSKRYALFTHDAGGTLRVARDADGEPAYSEHGLGHLLNPRDVRSDGRQWIVDTWESIVAEHVGQPVAEPPWLDRPALTRLTVSTPHLRRAFAAANDGLSYADQIKPFNFMLAAHPKPMGLPPDVNASAFLLVAPYEERAARWSRLPWKDVHSLRRFRIVTNDDGLYEPGTVRIQTYRDVLGLFRTHPEAKSTCPDGSPCDEAHKAYAGLLFRQPAFAPSGATEHVGKEMNDLDAALAGVLHDEAEVVTEFHDPRVAPIDRVRVLLRAMPMREILRRSNDAVSERTIERIRSGKTKPRGATWLALRRALIGYGRDGGAFTFEAMEQIDPRAIAAEMAALVAGAKADNKVQARTMLSQSYDVQIKRGLVVLGFTQSRGV